MKLKSAAWKYAWLTYRRDALWFPPALWALFVVIVMIMRHPAIRGMYVQDPAPSTTLLDAQETSVVPVPRSA